MKEQKETNARLKAEEEEKRALEKEQLIK